MLCAACCVWHGRNTQHIILDMSAPSPIAHPENGPAARDRWHNARLLVALLLGLGGFVLGGMLSVGGLVLLLVEGERLAPHLTLPLFSLAAIGAGLGLPLAWQSIAGLSGWPSRRFSLPLTWGLQLALAFLMSLIGGQVMLTLDLAPALTLPWFHAVALALPPFLLLWGAASLVRDPHYTWRQMWGGLGGAFGSLGLAFVVEFGLLAIGLVAVAIVVEADPDLASALSQLGTTPDYQALSELIGLLLRQPAILVMLFIGLGLIVPLVEEGCKSLVPALAGVGHKPTVARLFLWGVAGGAGFAVVEGMLNAGLGTQEWASVALLRIGSSTMHCLTAGLTGWGWGHVWAQRRWLHLLLAYALAVAIHGAWNSLSVGMIAIAETLEPGPLQSTLVTAAFMLLALLTLGMIAAVMMLANKLSKEMGGVT